MRKNSIHSITVHISDNMDYKALSDKINEFHIDLMKRRLKNSDLSTEEKIAVIDKIALQLKLRESNGIIK